MVRVGIYLVLLFAACAASGQVAPSLPGTYGSGEPLPAPVVPEPGKPPTTAPTGPEFSGGPSNDPGGDADFAEAKARFDAGDGVAARPLLEAFHEHHGAVRHVFTHRDVTAEVFRFEVARVGRARAGQRWVAPEGMRELGVSSFTRKTVALGLGSKRDNVPRRS